jgi:hypothetical protein
MLEYFTYIAAAAMLLAGAAYIRSMLRGGAKPNKVSWLMWSVAPFIATAASISSGVGWAALPVFMSGFMPFLIFAASFFAKNAYWKLVGFDYFCGAISAASVVLWYVTGDANVAIVFSVISDAAAAIPTILKAWKQPESESALPYTIGVFNAISSFAVAAAWSFSELAFPTYLIAINILLTLTVYNKKLRFRG